MIVVIALLLFWVGLRGEMPTYGGFVTKPGTDTFSLHDLWTAIIGTAQASTGITSGLPTDTSGLSPGVTGGGPGTPGNTTNPGGGANTLGSGFSSFLKLFSGSGSGSGSASSANAGSGAAGPANPPTGAGY